MISAALAPWLILAVPLLGAAAGFLFWARPDRLKPWCVGTAAASLLPILAAWPRLGATTEGGLFLLLLPLSACVSLLGQPIHRESRWAWVMTLVSLGLGLGVLTVTGSDGLLILTLLLGLITIQLYWHHDPFWGPSWLGIATCGLGGLSAAAAALTGSVVPTFLACAVLLPLVPLHHGYVAAVTRLPGSLPSFTVLLLPAIGLHRLAALVPTLPDLISTAIVILALSGAVYSTIKALAQSRVRLLVAYGSLAFCSVLWWFIVEVRLVRPQAAVFLGSVALATSGLLLAWQVIRSRYGDDVDFHAISGLAGRMPKFAVLLSLLALAAMGLPPFGVFAGFVGLWLGTPLTLSVAPVVVAGAWLAASWYLLDFVQRLLFGRLRPDLRYDDLRQPELASLVMIVLLLAALGLAPSQWFGGSTRAAAEKEAVAWLR